MQCKESMFSVPTDSGPLLILPQKWVELVKTLPDTGASFRKSFEFVRADIVFSCPQPQSDLSVTVVPERSHTDRWRRYVQYTL
jgi:hypothetical protein